MRQNSIPANIKNLLLHTIIKILHSQLDKEEISFYQAIKENKPFRVAKAIKIRMKYLKEKIASIQDSLK